MSRAKQRADRIRELIPVTQLLSDYGYTVHDGYEGEQQFSCDLHGDGSDSKPSARVYPDSNSWYCFACGRTRDVIETVKEKEGLEFWDAVKLIEGRYKLPYLPWDDAGERKERAPSGEQVVREAIDFSRSWEQEVSRLDTFIQGMTDDRDLPMDTLLRFWEAFDKVCYLVSKNLLDEREGRKAMYQIKTKALEKMKAMNT